MGRPSKQQVLALWANGERVGVWTLHPRDGQQLRYDPGWLKSKLRRPLSLSLPFLPGNRPHRGENVENYFENLLPDSEAIRKRVAQRFGAKDLSAFELLKAIGRDCVGAIQLLGLYDEPPARGSLEGDVLSEAQVAQLMANAQTGGGAGLGAAQEDEQDLRISLAGAQDKTALLRWNDHWLLPRGATATTHIFKLPLGLIGARKVNFQDSVDNEWLCLRLLRQMGLPAAHATIEQFEDQRVLCVERFDRKFAVTGTGPVLLRLPQEDFCQVLGCSYLRKYESDGGPGLKDIAGILRGAKDPEKDIRTLLKAQVMFWLLRAPDQHAKNYSISLLAGGGYSLTPLYDVLSAWPVMGNGPSQWSPYEVKLAMALWGKNRHYKVLDIRRHHFNTVAQQLGYGKDMEDILEEVDQELPSALDRVREELPPGFSERVADSILGNTRGALTGLL